MSRYSLIRSDLWMDKDVRKLNCIGKALYLYLITNPYGNIAGYYYLPVEEMRIQLGYREDEFYNEVVPILTAKNCLWEYNEDTSQVFIKSFLKYNKVTSASQLKAVNTQIQSLEVCKTHIPFLFSLNKYTDGKGIGYVSREILVKTKALCKGDTPIEVSLLNTLSIQSNTIPYNTIH